MKSKLKFILPVLLIVVGGVYKFVLAPPPAKLPPVKVKGHVYVLPKEFLVNLQDGRFAKLQVGLILDPVQNEATAVASGEGASSASPPDGYGANPQEGLVRDVITDTLTSSAADDLTNRASRDKLKDRIVQRINKETDVHTDHVLFTDITVQ